MLEYITIGMVYDKALTGYDIKKTIEAGIGLFYKASYGGLYPALKKLTDKGHLTMLEQPQGGRLKKYYKATESGKAAFIEWLSSPIDVSADSDAALARVYFFDKLPVDIRERRLQEIELFQFQMLQKLQTLEKHFAAMENTDNFYFMLSTLYYGIQLLHDNIRWCEHIKAQKPLPDFIREGNE